MSIMIVRAAIIYFAVTILIRFMGKRQIGEMQPSELVITLLISEVAARPIVEPTIPLITSISVLIILVAFEILISVINIKSVWVRTAIQGHPVTVIKDGQVDPVALKKLRISATDLLSALRQKDVFDIGQVYFAVYETNGKLSVLLKKRHSPPTASDLNIETDEDALPNAVICDGKIMKNNLKDSKMNLQKIEKFLSGKGFCPKDILIMAVNSDGTITLIEDKKQ